MYLIVLHCGSLYYKIWYLSDYWVRSETLLQRAMSDSLTALSTSDEFA